jgi:tRNA (mo5U34)-methyltransferase
VTDQRRSRLDAVPFWWHSIDVGDGLTSPGHKTPEMLQAELDALRLPDLGGKSVLDIGAWDGFFSFACEDRGASRVVALDHFVWSLDLARQQEYWRESMERGSALERYEDVPGLWRPDDLPGKAGFDTARELRQSAVVGLVGDFLELDLEELGQFDVVLYLGVLYHMADPLGALRRVAEVTSDLAVIETEAAVVPGYEDRPLLEFFPGAELNGDPTNWFVPNMAALIGLCTAAGFRLAESTLPVPPPAADGAVTHYRATVQARK